MGDSEAVMTVYVCFDPAVAGVHAELVEDEKSPGSYVLLFTERDGDGDVAGLERWLMGEPGKEGGFSASQLAGIAERAARRCVERLSARK